MKDLGPTKQILGIKISRDRSEGIIYVLISGKIYRKLLTRFNVGNAKTMNTPLAFKKIDDEGTTLGGNVNQTPSRRIVSIMVLDLVPLCLGL